jgi:centromeric protein E
VDLQHNERNFLLKFSAMEIYNESVRDLLSSDNTPLRLLDDPEVNIIFDVLKNCICKVLCTNI